MTDQTPQPHTPPTPPDIAPAPLPRPTAVVVAAVMQFICGALPIIGVLLAPDGEFRGNGLLSYLIPFGSWAALCLFPVIVGMQLLRLRSWARYASFGVNGWIAVQLLPALLTAKEITLQAFFSIYLLATIALYLCLLRNDVREAFAAANTRTAR